MDGRQEELTRAYRLLREGNPDGARAIGLKIGRTRFRNSVFFALMGELAWQRGRRKLGIRYFTRAIALAPENLGLQQVLGDMYEQTGELKTAEALYRGLVGRAKDQAQVYGRLGEILGTQQRWDEAISYYQGALRLTPQHARIWNNLAGIYEKTGDFTRAEAAFQRALDANPSYTLAMVNMGRLYNRQKKWEKAIAILKQALSVDIELLDAYNELTKAYHETKQFEAALTILQQAIEHGLEGASLYNNLGGTYSVLNQYDTAEHYYRKSLALNVDSSGTLGNLALSRFRQGFFEESLHYYEAALRQDPENHQARFGRGVWHLSRGELPAGWADYEARIPMDGRSLQEFTVAEWQGESLTDAHTLLVAAEQGFGDGIQFQRFMPQLKASGARIVLECLPDLAPLFHGYPGIDELVTTKAYRTSADPNARYVYLLSVPGRLGLTRETIPAPVDPARWVSPVWARQWQAKIPPVAGQLRVGIVWSSLKTNTTTIYRACSLKALDTLADVRGIHWYSLQKDRDPEAFADPNLRLQIHDLGPDLHDFSDTAGAILNLDLVITVDTAVAHLAGSLNKPTWLLLHKIPDWRWFLEGTTTPWYPSVSLYRQSTRDSWDEPLARIKSDLELWVKKGLAPT